MGNGSQLEKLLRIVADSAARMADGRIDPRQPKTGLLRMRRDIEHATDRIDGASLGSELAQIFDAVPAEKLLDAFRPRPMPRDARTRMAATYLDEVEHELPMASIIVNGNSLFSEFLPRWIVASDKLEAIKVTRREARASSLQDAAAYIEAIYKETILVLYEFECLRCGTKIQSSIDFGPLVDSVFASTKERYPGLVDPEASRIRNAAAHFRWEYEPGTQMLHLNNKHRGVIKWRKSGPLGAVVEQVREIFQRSFAFADALVWHTNNVMLRLFNEPPFNRLFLREVLRAPTPELRAAVSAAFSARFAPLNPVLAKTSWKSRRAEYAAEQLASAAEPSS